MDRELVIRIIRVGIGKECNIYSAISDVQDWDEVKVFAFNQGLSAVVLDGIDRMTKVATTLPASLKLEWIGDVLQNYEQRYLAYEKAISSLASFYDQHGFKMMLLKGYACALDWPIPKHRPCGEYASTFPHCSMKSSEYLWPKTKRLVKDERRSKSKLRVCA